MSIFICKFTVVKISESQRLEIDVDAEEMTLTNITIVSLPAKHLYGLGLGTDAVKASYGAARDIVRRLYFAGLITPFLYQNIGEEVVRFRCLRIDKYLYVPLFSHLPFTMCQFQVMIMALGRGKGLDLRKNGNQWFKIYLVSLIIWPRVRSFSLISAKTSSLVVIKSYRVDLRHLVMTQ